MNLNYNNSWDKVIKGQCNVQNCQKLWPVFIFQSKYAEYICEFFLIIQTKIVYELLAVIKVSAICSLSFWWWKMYFSREFCRRSEDGSCLFGGWARMAQPIVGFNVVEVRIILGSWKHFSAEQEMFIFICVKLLTFVEWH